MAHFPGFLARWSDLVALTFHNTFFLIVIFKDRDEFFAQVSSMFVHKHSSGKMNSELKAGIIGGISFVFRVCRTAGR